VVDEAPGWLVASDGLLQRLGHQRLRHARSERIAHDLAVVEILEGREIQKPLRGGDVREISDPDRVGALD